MKRDIIKVVEGVSIQEEFLSSGWRFVSCVEVKEGGRLREEVIQLLSDTQVAATEGSAYKLEDGKIFQNLNYNVVDLADHDNTESEIEFALMTKHTAVKLKIFRAKDLNEIDNFGSSNPFVAIWLINRHCRTPHGYVRTDYNSLTKREKEEFIVFQQETTVKMETANPEWNEEFYIYICPSDEILLLDVYAWNTGRKNKCLGRAVAEGLCETDRGRMDQSWGNPFEFELTGIVGTVAFHDKPSKLFVGYNHVADNSNGVAELAPVNDSVTDLMPQLSSNDDDSGIYESTLDNDEANQSLENNETNNDNLDSSYYSWQSIMQRFRDLPFDEPNSQRIQREIAEFYRRSLINAAEVEQSELPPGAISGTENDVPGAVGGTENDVPGAVGGNNIDVPGAVGGNDIDVPGAVGGTESCAPKESKEASNMIPSSQNFKAKYEAFINEQKAVAALELSSSDDELVIETDYFQDNFYTKSTSSSDELVIKIHKSYINDSFVQFRKIPQNKIYLLKAPLKIGRITNDNDVIESNEIRPDLSDIGLRNRLRREYVYYDSNKTNWFRKFSSDLFNPRTHVHRSWPWSGGYGTEPYHGLFTPSANDKNTLQINPKSEEHSVYNHLKRFKFVGQVAGMAVFHERLLEGSFIRPFYKMMLGKPITVEDMESVDQELFASLQWVRDNNPKFAQLKFTVQDEQPSGETVEKDLIPNGSEVSVTEQNKHEYIEKIIQWRFTSKIKKQMEHFMEGFNDVIPLNAIKIFDEEELELLISGAKDISVEDLRNNTEYDGYNSKSIVIQWFWDLMYSLDKEMISKFLGCITGTSKVRMNGLKELYTYGKEGPQRFTIRRWDTNEDRPRAISPGRLDLPIYPTASMLNEKLIEAIHDRYYNGWIVPRTSQ